MADITLTLDDELQAFIAEKVREGKHDSAADYIEFVLRIEILRSQRDRFEALLQEGLDSGEPTPVTDEFWADLRRHLDERLSQVKST